MDFTTSVYDSTHNDNFYPAESAGKSLSISELSSFVKQLLSTLELQELGALYFQQLNMLLPVVGFSISDFDSRWVYGNAKISSTLIDLPLQGAASSSGEQAHAYYYISSPLSMSQRETLFQLHDLFGKQVKHALTLMRLEQMATKDGLTGLGNRAGFEQCINRQLSWAQRHGEKFALLIIDLDNFKHVNDSFGHSEGDKVLIHVASHLTNVLREEDEAFRFGGDEFCCILDCHTPQQLACAAQRIQLSINNSNYLAKLGVSCSLGGTIYREDDSATSIFDRADIALYSVKNSGKNNYRAA
ncbi:diguanylate cyclase [Alteromonas sp. KUL42]|uniref:GGDEF domain-containing protein n=1 Tax=Alteromonas sp. KUL42 TaxID=2480797 RepID=UPI001036DE50|nr:GGDEF domain-containing protein [Alteromonas sp. KUL42]TAP37540.1 GGDEF domain-containing protein [Alteromonas sp. KUL42]GEA05965.1 diguanylate cyclase [Alteromonas sp. KUL42]